MAEQAADGLDDFPAIREPGAHREEQVVADRDYRLSCVNSPESIDPESETCFWTFFV